VTPVIKIFSILVGSLLPLFFSEASANDLCFQLFVKSPSPSSHVSTERYLTSTLRSFEMLRGENGLIKDALVLRRSPSGRLRFETLNQNTSPTNIAVDLLIQIELLQRSAKNSPEVFSRIERVLKTLEDVPHHEETGLFYSRYTTSVEAHVTDLSVSSIDNLHLALALWTLNETLPETPTSLRAKKLLERMDFSIYYDSASGLIGGNLRYENGQWMRESYNFANLGSEARALYVLGPALGLFRKLTTDEHFFERALSAMKIETTGAGDTAALRLWDGAAFQLFFPKIFINEDVYSSRLRQIFVRSAELMIDEGQRRQLMTPAAHSPSYVYNHSTGAGPSEFRYKDKTGNLVLVSSDAQDTRDPSLATDWESTFTPYALFMAATANPSRILPLFHRIENMGLNSQKLYDPSFGWMDAYHLNGPFKNNAVPVQLSLNQGMIALSLLQITSTDGLSPSGRALLANIETRKTLMTFYRLLDQKLNQ
jgi:hypothetical protein